MSKVAVFALLAVPFALQAAAPRLEIDNSAKPECTAKTRGALWPEKTARGDATPVEICAPRGFHYEWKQLTVDVSQLKAAVEAQEKKVVAAMPATTVVVGKRGANR